MPMLFKLSHSLGKKEILKNFYNEDITLMNNKDCTHENHKSM
jgi:hypothetical protein